MTGGLPGGGLSVDNQRLSTLRGRSRAACRQSTNARPPYRWPLSAIAVTRSARTISGQPRDVIAVGNRRTLSARLLSAPWCVIEQAFESARCTVSIMAFIDTAGPAPGPRRICNPWIRTNAGKSPATPAPHRAARPPDRGAMRSAPADPSAEAPGAARSHGARPTSRSASASANGCGERPRVARATPTLTGDRGGDGGRPRTRRRLAR